MKFLLCGAPYNKRFDVGVLRAGVVGASGTGLRSVRGGPAASNERLAGFIVAGTGMGSFDSAGTSLREVSAALKMTMLQMTML